MLVRIVVAIALCLAPARAFSCEPGARAVSFTGSTFPDLSSCSGTLETLSLWGAPTFPASIGNLTSLRELQLNYCSLLQLPAEIGHLTNLRRLSAHGNALSSLPESFANLVNLEYLGLSFNRFAEVPSGVLSLTSLTELSLSYNDIRTLPVELANLINIRSVDLSFNPVDSVPPELGASSSLTFLYVDFACLPRSVKRLPQLRYRNHLPTCTNNTVSGYVIQRSRKDRTCGGPVRNVTGFATGCINQVRITCEEQDDGNIVVTRRHFSDLDSRSLTCLPDAPVTSVTTDTYPRCDEHSGVATSCADLDSATEVPFPHKHAGLVTVTYDHYEDCNHRATDLEHGRRLITVTDGDLEATAVLSADPTVPSVGSHDRHRPHPNHADRKSLMEMKRKHQVDSQLVKAKRNAAAARAAKQTTEDHVYTCDPDSTVSLTVYPVSGDIYDLRNCTSLRYLSIYGYDAELLAEAIPYLAALEHLTLESYSYMGLPDNLHQLHALKFLDVFTACVVLPEVLRNMTQLTHLRYLDFLYDIYLPGWLAELSNLRSLDLSGGFFTGFPPVLTQMVNLRNLSLSSIWPPHHFPESLANLVNLYSLDLSQNQLNLYSLDLSQDGLSTAPAFLARMTQLRALNLSYCALSDLPETFGDLVNLHTLSLEGNFMRCLPDKVRQLSVVAPTTLLGYPACPLLPLSFAHQRNAACLWDPYYEFWYRAACDGIADTLTVTLYADSACKKKAKRAAVHNLHQQFPGFGYCMPALLSSFNGTVNYGYSMQYCHT